MRAGDLRHRVEIVRAAVTRDASGAEVKTWPTLAHRWAQVRPLNGQEQLQAQQAQASMTHRIRIRYYEGLTVEDRIKFDGRFFDINSIADQDERHREMLLMCSESPTEQA